MIEANDVSDSWILDNTKLATDKATGKQRYEFHTPEGTLISSDWGSFDELRGKMMTWVEYVRGFVVGEQEDKLAEQRAAARKKASGFERVEVRNEPPAESGKFEQVPEPEDIEKSAVAAIEWCEKRLAELSAEIERLKAEHTVILTKSIRLRRLVAAMMEEEVEDL